MKVYVVTRHIAGDSAYRLMMVTFLRRKAERFAELGSDDPEWEYWVQTISMRGLTWKEEKP